MKKFIFNIIFLSTPILIFVLAVNYFGDAANLFNDYEKEIANILIKKSNVTNISNYDERLVQKHFIERIVDNPNFVILGSSRTMLINSTYFNKLIIYNNSVSGASIEDLIAIFQLYKNKQKIPQKILIGIDPWTFNENNGQIRWKSLSNEYLQFFGKENKSKDYKFKYKELFSFSYFQSSIKSLIKKEKPIATKDTFNLTNTRMPDGSLAYGEKYRNASSDEIEKKLTEYLTGNIYSIENFDKISIKIQNDFILLLNEITENNIEISFFLAPYHPVVYDYIKTKNKYSNIIETEKIIIKIADERQIKIFGSFNPNQIGLDNSDFYDGMHCNEKGISKIMNN